MLRGPRRLFSHCANQKKDYNVSNVVVYHFEMQAPATRKRSVSTRAATREAIEALGFEPLMETAQVVERARLDESGFVRPEAKR